MTTDYAIYITTDKGLIDTLPGYANPIITSESTTDMYNRLDTVEVDNSIVVIEDNNDIDCILKRHRERKISCGNYLLKRNIILVMDEDNLKYTKENWGRMMDDGSLRLLPD